jgi:GGDEF domain-containing protein
MIMLKKRVSQTGAQDIPRVINGVMKLKSLTAPPELDQLRKMLEYAQKTNARFVEQQWTIEAKNELFILRCAASSQEVPVWVFLAGSLTRMPTERWNHPTSDIGLIQNIIHSETEGAVSELRRNDDMLTAAGSDLTALVIPHSERASAASVIAQSQTGSKHLAVETETQVILQGDLVLVQLPTLLQSIQMSKMTGRLELRNHDGKSDTYFDEGKPVHAEYCGSTGDLAVIELLSWQDGQFRFFPGERTVERTIRNRLDALLMEGMTFADQSSHLARQGLTMSTFLIRKKPDMTQKEFESILQGCPIDLRLAANFYCQLDDTRMLLDLLRAMPLHKTEWVPVLFNLVTQGIVVCSDKPAKCRTTPVPTAESIDQTAIETAMRSSIRNETGVFTQGALLFFIQQEFARFEAGGLPFSLLLFEGQAVGTGGEVRHLPETALKEVIHRTKATIRPFEIFAHYRLLDFALFLPQTEIKTAALVAQRLLLSFKTIPKTDSESYEFRFGVAGVPGDGANVSSLLASAQLAMERAVETQSSMMLFRTLLS